MPVEEKGTSSFLRKQKYSKPKNVQDVHSWTPFPFMQDPQLCKKLLLLVLADTIGTILLADLKGSSSDASPFGEKTERQVAQCADALL